MNKASLYFHIPFCLQKCRYCAFYSLPCPSQGVVDVYTDAVLAHIKSSPQCRVPTVYFGGGTPSVIGAQRLVGLLSAAAAHHNFEQNAEITVEVNPKTIDFAGLSTLRAAGFNRLSMGLQSADDTMLKTLGRIHTSEDFLACYDSAVRAGFDSISVDIMFGLPNSSPQMLQKTLDFVRMLSPKHISAYSLILEEGTHFYQHRDGLSFMGEEDEEEEYALICKAFGDYEHYEISAFARDGYRSRHNMNYWQRGDYLGYGAAAHSLFGNRRFAFSPDTGAYGGDDFLTDGGFYQAQPLSESEIFEEQVMLGLRTADGIAIWDGLLSKVEQFMQGGLVEIIGDRLRLTERGFRLSNRIIGEIVCLNSTRS